MNVSCPLAVTAAAGKPHRAGYDTPESVVVTAKYSEDFIGVFRVNYVAMRYRSRREDCRVFMQGTEETPAIEKRSENGFGWATDLHFPNFLERIRARQTPPRRCGSDSRRRWWCNRRTTRSNMDAGRSGVSNWARRRSEQPARHQMPQWPRRNTACDREGAVLGPQRASGARWAQKPTGDRGSGRADTTSRSGRRQRLDQAN